MRRFLVLVAAALGLAIVGSLANSTAAAGSASSSGRPGLNTEWHRLNPDQSNPAPEHERLTCLQGRGWSCHYDTVPEPRLTGQLMPYSLMVLYSWVEPNWLRNAISDWAYA